MWPLTHESEEKNNININLLGRLPGRENPRERPVSLDAKSLCWALFYCKTQGIPNINFSEHELLAVPRLVFQKVYAKKS